MPKSMFRHRLPALSSAILITAGLALSLSSGLSCDFVSSSSNTFSLGIYCPNTIEGQPLPNDLYIILSKIFLSISWLLSTLNLFHSWSLTLLIPPNDLTWKLVSILSGLACIVSIPAFLLVETSVCNGEYGQCVLSTGAYMLIASATCHAIVSALTLLVSPPGEYSWDVKENWTVGCLKGGCIHSIAVNTADALQKVRDGIDRKRHPGLRYVGTQETSGGGGGGEHNGSEFGAKIGDGDFGEDHSAREMVEDSFVMDRMELGEFSGLTIDVEADDNNNDNKDGDVKDGSASVRANGHVKPPDPPALNDSRRTDAEEYQEDFSSSYGDTTTDDEASRFAQLRTSQLGVDSDDSDDDGSTLEARNDNAVGFKERPPAYNLDSPYLIEDEARMEQAKREAAAAQQYWADEEAHLAPPSDAEDNAHILGSGSVIGSDEAVTSDEEGEFEDEDGAAVAVAAVGVGVGAAAAAAANNNNKSSSKDKLLEKSKNMRSSLQTLRRKISGGLGSPAAAAEDGGNKKKGFGLGALGAGAGGGGAAYLAMESSASEAASSRATTNSKGSPGGDGSGGDSSKELKNFIEEIEIETFVDDDDDQERNASDDDDDQDQKSYIEDGDEVRSEGGISFIRVDSNLSAISATADGNTPTSSPPADDDSPEDDVSSLIEQHLAKYGDADQTNNTSPPPPPPPQEEGASKPEQDQYSDPPVAYYPSDSEVSTESDLEDVLEDMPEDELAAYTSDDGSSVSSGQSGQSYSSYTSASGNEADDSSLSSLGESGDEKDNMTSIVAGVLERQESKKKKSRISRSRGERRRKKKKKKRKRKVRHYSSNCSLGSRSLLDETIEEETDTDLKEMEDSSGGMSPDGDKAVEATKEDFLIAGSRFDEGDILNTIIETSMSKDLQDESEELHESTGGYESGYLSRSRSPAASDSEQKPFSALSRIITPSPRKGRAGSKANYHSLACDVAYFSAPEPEEEELAAIVPRYKNLRGSNGYMSDNHPDLAIHSGHGDIGISSLELARRPPKSNAVGLGEHDAADDSSIDQAADQHHRYEMPTSWKAEKSLRPPMHTAEQYFSDSSSNTDSSSDFSSRTASSKQARQARRARMRRLSMQKGSGGGSRTRTQPSNFEPHSASNIHSTQEPSLEPYSLSRSQSTQLPTLEPYSLGRSQSTKVPSLEPYSLSRSQSLPHTVTPEKRMKNSITSEYSGTAKDRTEKQPTRIMDVDTKTNADVLSEINSMLSEM